MAGVPFAAASSGPSAIVATLRFNPVPDEDMLPEGEARKEIADDFWDVFQMHNVDCIFDNKLPANEEYNYAETPLNTVPVLVQQTQAGGAAIYTQKGIDRSVDDRAAVEFSNTKKVEMRARILIDYKCVIAVSLLKALKVNAPLFESQMRKDHILVAATATMPAKHDGFAIFRAFHDHARTTTTPRARLPRPRLTRSASKSVCPTTVLPHSLRN